ncbi:MAG: peptide chain release factor 2 [Candidatus Omnitrophica bacterium]|nr:peptide chain release factor 2 [Candidatus Omnitrophota bacterium]
MSEDIKIMVTRIQKRVDGLRRYLDVGATKTRIEELEKEISNPEFWGKSDKRNSIIRELKACKSQYDPFRECEMLSAELAELATIVDPDDKVSQDHLRADMEKLDKRLELLEFQRLLSGPADRLGAIVSINAGAGGTESCDWAAMLARMYKRWADDEGFKTEEIDVLPGEEAGIKNITFAIRGSFVYGYLKGENGVHRLVRISPFDSNKRRHTSFASVEVIPEVEDDIQIDILPQALKIDTFRAGGAGGQNVNMTDSAVRTTHAPTGIVVQCQNERSQHKNKASAMKMLKSRLYDLKLKERQDKQQVDYNAKNKIEWGSQIRSYVLHPYNLVKDHRTDHENTDSAGVLDGALDGFVQAYLKMKATKS